MKKIIVLSSLCSLVVMAQGWLSPSIKAKFPKHLFDLSKRVASFPYITGDGFRSFANHICDETNQPFDPKSVKNGDTIFIHANPDVVRYFFTHYHPHIEAQYIIITHNDDWGRPGEFAPFLDDPKIIAWFAQNADRFHEKLIPIPIGISNPVWGAHGNPQLYTNALRRKIPLNQKNKKLFVNFRTHTNRARASIYNYFSRKPFAYCAPMRSHEQHLEEMKEYAFILSPPGNGFDCMRTWEALMLDCIPIVLSSPLNPMFENLPVIIVEKWEQISENFLHEAYESLAKKDLHQEKVWINYWLDLIRSYQEKYRNPS